MKTICVTLILLTLATVLSWSVRAGDSCGCCSHCGCNNVQKVCRLVPVVTKVPKTELCCKCEDICVPGKSIYCGTECVTDCDGNCCQQKVYQPTCGKVYTKSSVVKTTTMVEKCGYKCVVEYVCGGCGCCCGSSGASSGYSSGSNAPAPATGGYYAAPHAEAHPLHKQSN
jgi:hypothetical protein